MSILTTNRSSANISVEHLREALDYNPKTGVFTWKVRPVRHFADRVRTHPAAVLCAKWNGKFAGKPAFTCRDPRGYAKGALDQVPLWAHRVAIAISTGKWPDAEVDHINRDKADNRLTNLRVVSHSENRRNTADCDRASALRREAAEKPARLRLPGVRRSRSGSSWAVRVKRDGAEHYLGSFRCFGHAIQARLSAGWRS